MTNEERDAQFEVVFSGRAELIGTRESLPSEMWEEEFHPLKPRSVGVDKESGLPNHSADSIRVGKRQYRKKSEFWKRGQNE